MTPDGHTTLFSSLSLLVNAILLEGKVKYDPFKDFAPISNAAVLPMVVVTSPQTGINTVQELIAQAKAKPGEVSYGTSGHAGSTHLAGAMLENFTGTKMINVPFKGNGPALAEVMAGRVTFMFYPAVGIADQVAQKRLKVLAVGTAQPWSDFPGVPTLEEMGLRGFDATAPWVGLRALRPIPLALAAAVATFATFLALHRLPAPVVPPAAANIVSSSPGVAAVPPSPGPGSESDLANDEAWNLISAVASGVELEEAHAAGFGVRPGEIDRAVGEMTPVERTVLGRLLQQELKRAGA